MDIEKAKALISSSKKILGFTGAGISTESGISDYRSKGGLWQKFQPVYIDEFVKDEEKRILYWQRKEEQWEDINNATPNQGHVFFKELHDKGKLLGIITQNIDGLHEKSGVPKEIIVNLHGNTLETKCLSCNFIIPSEDAIKEFNLKKSAPLCKKCKGLLKPNTISFGQQLDPQDLTRAKELSMDCDLMIVMGSTLIVQPAASFPLIAKENSAGLIIINMSDTPLDRHADLVFRMKIKEFVEGI